MNIMKKFIVRLFPSPLNNDYRGALIALYLFIPLTALTVWRSFHHLLAADGGAQSIATIPLDTFSADGSAAVIGAFSLWGLSQLIIGILYVVSLIRYRRLLPLLYLLLMVEYLMRELIVGFKPIPTAGTAPGGVINIPLVIVSALMLIVAMREIKPDAPWFRRLIGL